MTLLDPQRLTWFPLQAMEVGFTGDLRGLYSNGLEERHTAAVQRYLTGSLGFELVKEKTSISLHVLDEAHNTSHCIVFNEGRCSTWQRVVGYKVFGAL